MNRILVAIVAVSLAGCATLGTAPGQRTVLSARDRVAPALIHVKPVKTVFQQGEQREQVVTGSGFIISPDGYAVTNEHVAGDAKFVRCVLWNQAEVDAEVVGTDKATDLALLKLETDDDLPVVELGSSADLEAGQTVLALGSPHGLARSVSMGIISTSERYLGANQPGIEPYFNYVQTDAAINPGNSGGPLTDQRGRVIGINTLKLVGADNVGFAVPVDIAKEVIEDLREHGAVRRAWVGISLQELTVKTSDPEARGVLIGDVAPLSPALEATAVGAGGAPAAGAPVAEPAAEGPAGASGIQPGDVLVAINGMPVSARYSEDLPAVNKQLADLAIGEPARLTIERAGRPMTFQVVPEERGDLTGEQVAFEWGFTAAEVTPAIARRAQLPRKQGVIVTGVQPGSIAAEAGLNRGDIILTLEETAVRNMQDFRNRVEELMASGKSLVLMDAKRGAVVLFVLMKQEATGPVVDATVAGPAEEETDAP